VPDVFKDWREFGHGSIYDENQKKGETDIFNKAKFETDDGIGIVLRRVVFARHVNLLCSRPIEVTCFHGTLNFRGSLCRARPKTNVSATRNKNLESKHENPK
jgi:hypothetical protein